jgi:hypothetical protein
VIGAISRKGNVTNGCAVVTGEDVGNHATPHILYVCRARRIRVLSVLELIQEERWVI